MLIVISGPSGSGKTTVVHAMLERFPDLVFSVSATTRARRPKEREGWDYYFLTEAEFRRRIEAGELVEWEEIFGNLYGTLRPVVDGVLAQGKHMLFDIDVKGALSIKRIYGEDSTSIFIRPPDFAVLRERLRHRGTDGEEIVERRLSRAAMEIESAARFDHVVVNDEIGRACDEVAEVIRRIIASRTPARHTEKEN